MNTSDNTNYLSPKEDILRAIRDGKPHAMNLPEIPTFPFAEDKEKSFAAHLGSFDGKMVSFESRGDALIYLQKELDEAKKIFSSLPDYGGNIQLADFKTPHDANVVDICVGEGVIGVAETGSVWVTEKSLGLAAAALFSTDLFLLLDRKMLKGNLHEAYAAISVRDNQYGSFYTGPSATADIEAVHVTGAQGEISLTVLLYG